ALEAEPARDVLGRRAEHRLPPASQTGVRADAGRTPLVTREMPLEDGEAGGGQLCPRRARHARAAASDDRHVPGNTAKGGSGSRQPEPVAPAPLQALALAA